MMKHIVLGAVIMWSARPVFAGLKENKEIAQAFYEMAFNQHEPTKAAMKYLSEDYIQHNPYVGTGRKAFIEAFADEPKGKKNTSINIFKRLIAEDDLVVMHIHKKKSADDVGVAGVDIFRIKDGKITEHWDVNQKIPDVIKHQNTMF